MSKIYLINNGITRAVDDIVTGRLRDSLNSEMTLNVTLTADDVGYINDATIIQYSDQYYTINEYIKDTNGQSPICVVDSEHISYMLTDEEYMLESFSMTGTPWQLMSSALAGTPFSAGVIETTATITININERVSRRALINTIATVSGGEIEYSGYAINIRNHRGSIEYKGLLETDNVIHVSASRSVREGITTYAVTLGRKTTLSIGDNIKIKYSPLSLNENTRIIAIEYNPYNEFEVSIEVGDYVPDIVDNYNALNQKTNNTAEKVERIAEDYVSTSTVDAKIETYIDSEAGTAKIIAACEGVYTTEDAITGLVSETEVKAIIESQISESGGSIKLYVEGKNYITQTTADGVYTKKTELNTEISQYIDTTAGTAKIVSACAAVYQTQSGMSGYVTKTEMSTSITQEVNSKFATLKLETSASTSGGQTTSTLTLKSGSETLGSSAVIAATTAAQASTIAASAVNGITLTASTSVASNQTTTTLTLKNGTTTIDSSSVVGTTAAQAATISASAVNGITLSVTNAEKSSTLTLKNGTTTITSGTIQMTGIVTISDLAGTTTTINGANIKTGTISADRIDVSNLKVVTIWMDSKRVVYTSASSMYLGGDTSSGAVSDMYIRSISRLILSNSWTSDALICNWATKTFEPGLTSNFSLGTSAKRWKMIYTEGLDAEGNIVPRSSSLYSLGTSALRFKETHTEKLLIGSTSNNTIEINTSRELRPGYTSASYPFYLGTSSYPWHYAYIGSVSALLGTGAASRLGFYGETPITRLTLSTSSNNQSYSSATASNYLYILNNIVGMLKKYGLISA